MLDKELKFQGIKDQFIGEWGAGKNPTLQDYAANHPEFVEELVDFVLNFAHAEAVRANTLANMSDDKRGMTVREAGRLGGLARRENIGAEGFRALGQKGGRATKNRHGEDHYRRIGRLGGLAAKEAGGEGFYREIGKKGAARVKRLIEQGLRKEQEETDERASVDDVG